MPEWVIQLLPVLTAFGGLFAGHWLSESSKRRENLDEWWERYAVTEGIEPVINHVRTVQQRLTKHLGFDSVPDSMPIPSIAVLRVINLTRVSELDSLLVMAELIETHGVPEKNILEFSDTLADVMLHLLALHGILLDIHIKKKSDVMFIWKHPEISYLQSAIDKISKEMKPIPDTTMPPILKERMRMAKQSN